MLRTIDLAEFLGDSVGLVAGATASASRKGGRVHRARRRDFRAGNSEKIGLAIALLITGTGVMFAYQGANSVTGTVDGSPPQAFYIFIIAGSLAAAGEINVLVRRKLSQVARKTRHLWRMCFSFFIASGSLSFGQPQVFPDWFNMPVADGRRSRLA